MTENGGERFEKSRMVRREAARKAQGVTLTAILVNGSLALIKGVAGVLGNSYALVADAIESLMDVLSSVAVWGSLKVAASPPTERHPYGKGRIESLAAIGVALVLLLAAGLIAVQSVKEIRTPHHAPAPFTLVVLVAVVVVKEGLVRCVFRAGEEAASTAVKADAWHHRSDAITSAAAFVGISIALWRGPGYESADDWAALLAAAVIVTNAILLMRPALGELMDAAPNAEVVRAVREAAEDVPGVRGTHRCWVRKQGFDLFVELDVLVDGELTVREGHAIAHDVHEAIRDKLPMVSRVMVHVEPRDEFGRFQYEWERD